MCYFNSSKCTDWTDLHFTDEKPEAWGGKHLAQISVPN